MPDRETVKRIREVVPGIYRIVVPLPIPDVESVNAYVIAGDNRNIIIDPGIAHPACLEVMEKAIGDLGVDLGRTDFFVTHHHLDHFGAVGRFLGETSRIYISKPETDIINRIESGDLAEDMRLFLEMLGFPEKDPTNLYSQFYGNGYRWRRPWPFHYVADGDVLVQGSHRFTCLVAPGHTIGHSCLYEPSRRLLISGDAITAGVQFWLDRTNPLADHYQTFARLREMDVVRVLPGHGSPFPDHRKRIDHMRAHHQGREEAACAALGDDGKDAYEVTVALDGKFPDRAPLKTLPLVLRFIHTRHTFAYLQHLTSQGRARKEHCRGRCLFFRGQPTT